MIEREAPPRVWATTLASTICFLCGGPLDAAHYRGECPKDQSQEQQPPRDAGGRIIDQQIWESFEESR